MIRIFLPPAERSCLTILVRFRVVVGMFAFTQPAGLGLVGQVSTSLPPIEIVTTLTWLGCPLMNARAACI